MPKIDVETRVLAEAALSALRKLRMNGELPDNIWRSVSESIREVDGWLWNDR